MDRGGTLRGLYVITPDTPDTGDCLARVQATLRGGARILQYRDKSGDAARQRATAQALRALTRDAGALLIVNDSLPLALAVEADGVHLGGDDGDLAAARQALEQQRQSIISGLAAVERLMPRLHTWALTAGALELDNLLAHGDLTTGSIDHALRARGQA